VLERYTLKCSSELNDVKNVEDQAVKADEVARIRLHDTWHSVVHELGLIAAMIVDSDGFLQLGRFDTVSINSAAHRSSICGSGGRLGNEAAISAVEGALEAGLAFQTWQQLRWIYVEMSVLRDRFASEGLQVPTYEPLMQAAQRLSKSFQGLLVQRRDLAVEVAARLCDHKQSLFQTSPQDSKAMKGALKELQEKFESFEERLEVEHTADEKIAAKLEGHRLEAQHSADEKKSEAQHAADVKMLEAQHSADEKKSETFEERLEAQHAAGVKMLEAQHSADEKKSETFEERLEAQHAADDKKIRALVVGVLVVIVLATLGWALWRK